MYRNFLIVAGNGKVREALGSSIRQKGFTVTLAASGSEALMVVRNVSVEVVLIESHLADIRADMLRSQILQARPGCRAVILTSFGTVRNSPELLRFGMDDYVLRSDQVLDLLTTTFETSGEHGSPAEKGKQALLEVVDVLVGLLELGDRFFGGCSHQAMRLSREVAEEMGVEEETLDEVVIATLLRDIGKAGIDPHVLSETGSFSEEQMERMRGHVGGSLRLLEHIDFPWKVIPVIRHHHERYDGRGYPDGLRGREIPIGARIVSVVDAYVAMVSDRSHRQAMRPEEAQEELVRLAGTQFDPEVVEVFLRVIEKRESSRGTREKPVVLIVDAQEDFRNLLKMRLLNEGLEIRLASNAEGALDLLIQDPPDLVLADVLSEGSDTFQLLREIREDESLRHIPFAFLSDRDDRILKVRALRQGVDDFLLKTEDLDDLVARVENILIRESVRHEEGTRRRRRGITGQIENLPLPDIVQTLAIGLKTACVTLSSGKNRGRIWFEEGTIRHATTDSLEGDQAFHEMVRWPSGEFVIEHGVRSKKESISHDAMFLLMESLRLMDEQSSEGHQREEEDGAPVTDPAPTGPAEA
ncbi:MAG: hypothetical protein DMF49_08545 [Acidobacteria bacterium]|nr:MAG: hypothetical protein DMF49_08545 [Acidobacteriota bacterium]